MWLRKILILLLLSFTPVLSYGGIEFIGQTSNTMGSDTTVQCTMPAGILANDILIVVGSANSSGTATLSINDGAYTQVTGSTDNSRVFYVWWKRSTGSESTITVSFNQTNRLSCGVTVWRGVKDTGSPFNVVGTVSNGTTGVTRTAAGVITTVENCMLLFPGSSGGGTHRANNFSTPVSVVAYNEDARFFTYGIQTVAGASGDKSHTWTDASSHSGRIIVIALEPFIAPVSYITRGIWGDTWNVSASGVPEWNPSPILGGILAFPL